jgi:hypothetical protein
MKYDLFEFFTQGMPRWAVAWRVAVLALCLAALGYDLYFGRPG